MKKVIIFLLALMGFAGSASAQLGEKTTFGLRAGLGFGGYTSSDAYRLFGGTKASNWDISNKHKATYNAGVIIDVPVYRRWGLSVQSGLWFTERNSTFDGVNVNNSSTWRKVGVKAMYVQLPIQVGYHYNFGIVNVQALFGPYFEYRVNDGKGHAEYSNNIDTESDAFSSDDNNFATGLTFGLGAEYKHSYLGIKYDLGLTNYYSGSNDNRKDKEKLDLKGSMFSIVLGWNF